jgi:hypothetical protein
MDRMWIMYPPEKVNDDIYRLKYRLYKHDFFIDYYKFCSTHKGFLLALKEPCLAEKNEKKFKEMEKTTIATEDSEILAIQGDFMGKFETCSTIQECRTIYQTLIEYFNKKNKHE